MSRGNKELVTCVTLIDGKPHARTQKNRVVYARKDGSRYIRDDRGNQELNSANEFHCSIKTLDIETETTNFTKMFDRLAQSQGYPSYQDALTERDNIYKKINRIAFR